MHSTLAGPKHHPTGPLYSGEAWAILHPLTNDNDHHQYYHTLMSCSILEVHGMLNLPYRLFCNASINLCF